MKNAFSLGTVEGSNGALFYKWYWERAVEWAGATCFKGLEIPYKAWTFNDARGGAPLCADAINIKYGSPTGYLDFVKKADIKEGVASFFISAGNLLDAMQQNGINPDLLLDKMTAHGLEALDVLHKMNGSSLVISVSPSIGVLKMLMQDKQMEEIEAYIFNGMSESVNNITARARKMGIKVYIRNEFFGVTRGDKVTEFMDMLSEDVGFSPDLAHLQIAGADTEALLKKYRGRLGCVVFKDTFFSDEVNAFESMTPEFPQEGKNQRVYCEMGRGTVPFAKYCDLLMQLGFDGWLIFETGNAFDLAASVLTMAAYRVRLGL